MVTWVIGQFLGKIVGLFMVKKTFDPGSFRVVDGCDVGIV
jgi:hypothetical protein